jgi:hypothetical protein
MTINLIEGRGLTAKKKLKGEGFLTAGFYCTLRKYNTFLRFVEANQNLSYTYPGSGKNIKMIMSRAVAVLSSLLRRTLVLTGSLWHK